MFTACTYWDLHGLQLFHYNANKVKSYKKSDIIVPQVLAVSKVPQYFILILNN